MTTFTVTYRYREGSDAARTAHRPAHIAFLGDLHEAGLLYMSGPVAADPPGALLVFEDADEATLAERLDADPFFVNDLIAHRGIAQWNVFFDPRANGAREC
ncbi:MAG: YciI family protein [Microbacterium sp.]|uniref:YciI family protein n=1 Tax=Microbacterium sp. TaxID=51671 RepID=UPI003241BADF